MKSVMFAHVKREISSLWSELNIPVQVVEAFGPEELEMKAYLAGKGFLAVNFYDHPLAGDSIFIHLTPYAQFYYLGGLMLHVLSILETVDANLAISFPFITLVCALEISEYSYTKFARELLSRKPHLQCFRSFIEAVFAPPAEIPQFSREAREIVEIWNCDQSVMRCIDSQLCRRTERKERGE